MFPGFQRAQHAAPLQDGGITLDFTPDLLALGAIWYLVFVFSTTCHEAAHAWAALKLGDSTAYHGGQVSLSPLPHMKREPFGMVLMPLLSFFSSSGQSLFGWASAPYDPSWALTYPKRSALMAAAGPAANFVLALAAAIGMLAGIAGDLFQLGSASGDSLISAVSGNGAVNGLATTLWVAFALNILLGVFNLFPLPPLDGSAIIQLLMSDETARRYRTFLWEQPMIGMATMMIAIFFLGPVAGGAVRFAAAVFVLVARALS